MCNLEQAIYKKALKCDNLSFSNQDYMEQTIEGVPSQEDSLERLPENIREFLRSNKELLEQREAEILELLAGSTSPDDRQAAEEAFLETESWQRKIEEGRITGIPPKAMLEDKNIMVAVKITDPKVRQLFNTAASQVTRSFDGFQQFGQNPLEGLTAWELKNGNNQQFPTLHQLEYNTYKEMLSIALDTHPQ
jgi:hypothetical protein